MPSYNCRCRLIIPSTQILTGSPVTVGSTIHSDAHTGYRDLNGLYYNHYVLDHAVRHVEGSIHTNSIESFWNLYKRGARGTYTHVAPKNVKRRGADA